MNKCPKSSQSCQTGDYQIERETAKLFTQAPLEKLIPFILLGFWIAILFAIFSS